MTFPTTYVLLGTSVSTAVLHTLIPDHWLPFVLIGRSRGWSLPRTTAISGVSALIHTALSVLLAQGALVLGVESAHLLGSRLGEASVVLLIGFGVVYGAWSLRKGGHFHPGGAMLHGSREGTVCHGAEGDEGDEHLHYHADDTWIRGRSSRSDLFLAAIIGLNPCILFMPILLKTAEQGAAAVVSVTLAYSMTTIVLMVGLSVAGVAGARGLVIPVAARHMEAASGFLIALVGIVFWLVGG